MGFFQREPLSSERLGYAFVLGPSATALAAPIAMMVMTLPTLGLSDALAVVLVAPLVAIFYGVPATLLIALPAFMQLRGRFGARPGWLIALGALTAAGPYFVFFILPTLAYPGAIYRVMAPTALVLSSGALGGWVFWLIAAWRPKQARGAQA